MNYFITCFDESWMRDKEAWFGNRPLGTAIDDASHTHCFGYYADREKAISAVEANLGDLQEHLYRYCVVEGLPEGIHPITKSATDGTNVTWFEWQGPPSTARDVAVPGRWVQIPAPEATKRMVNFALG